MQKIIIFPIVLRVAVITFAGSQGPRFLSMSLYRYPLYDLTCITEYQNIILYYIVCMQIISLGRPVVEEVCMNDVYNIILREFDDACGHRARV